MPDIKVPDERHPISITAGPKRVIVKAGEVLIADSAQTLRLLEAGYPAVYYVPRGDVVMAKLVPSQHSTHCPYKGEASYFNVSSLGGAFDNSIWTYEHPYPAVASIAGYLAFYSDRFEIMVGD